MVKKKKKETDIACVTFIVTKKDVKDSTVGAFDKLTLWQQRGDKVAPSTHHGVKSPKCYTAVAFPGALVLCGGVISTGTIWTIKLVQENTKCKLQN